LDYIASVEKLKQLNTKGGSCIASSSTEDIMYRLESEKNARLRRTYDKVRELRRQKLIKLNEMKSQTEVRDNIDEEVIATLDSAEYTMNALEDRFLTLSNALSEAMQLNQVYSKLITFLKVNRPFSDTHMASLEQEVSLARQQLQDLKRFRMSLYQEAEKIHLLSMKTTREKLRKIKSDRRATQKKIRDTQDAIATMELDMMNIPAADRPDSKKAPKSSHGERGGSPSHGTRVSDGNWCACLIFSSLLPQVLLRLPMRMVNLLSNSTACY